MVESDGVYCDGMWWCGGGVVLWCGEVEKLWCLV